LTHTLSFFFKKPITKRGRPRLLCFLARALAAPHFTGRLQLVLLLPLGFPGAHIPTS
jgi:hypothetical protein